MKTKIMLSATLIAALFILPSAIIRNDVVLEKYLAFARRPEFSSAGEVLDMDGKTMGSCVLIEKRFVLTCAHLPVFQRSEPIKCLFGQDTFKVKRFVIFPGYVRKTNKNPDLCVMELTKEITDIKPAQLYKRFSEKGEKGSIIGYGYIEFADMDHSPTINGQKIGGQNMIDSIGGATYPGDSQPSLCFADFDSPGGKICCNIMGSKNALPLEYGLTGGDSGGPMFIKEQGEYKVAGIGALVKHITSPLWYGTISGWTRVSVFSRWIEQTVQSMQSAETN